MSMCGSPVESLRRHCLLLFLRLCLLQAHSEKKFRFLLIRQTLLLLGLLQSLASCSLLSLQSEPASCQRHLGNQLAQSINQSQTMCQQWQRQQQPQQNNQLQCRHSVKLLTVRSSTPAGSKPTEVGEEFRQFIAVFVGSIDGAFFSSECQF